MNIADEAVPNSIGLFVPLKHRKSDLDRYKSLYSDATPHRMVIFTNIFKRTQQDWDGLFRLLQIDQ